MFGISRGQSGPSSGTTSAQHSFAQVPRADIPRSVFNRSCGLKTNFQAGDLVPIFVDEALPGDTVSMNMSSFARTATPLRPVLDNAYMDFFFFAVPNRLIWDNWQKFNGEQVDPGDSTDFLIPQIVAEVDEGTLGDYFGLPINIAGISYSSLWHRAYNLIWNEWFRDENLQDSLVVDRDDGPDDIADYVLQKRGKRHDYFSSCLPFTQKGSAVELPLGSTAPLVSTGTGEPTFDYDTRVGQRLEADNVGDGDVMVETLPVAKDWLIWNDPALEVDLSAATAATINSIREAFQIQKLLERDARGGTRYTEIVRSHFGVVSPDQRLQRPEYLGGGSSRININPVPGTNRFTTTVNIGDLGAFATASAQQVGFVKSFVEHCVIIGLVNVRADLTYQQGLDRMFSRRTRYDFYWPAFAHLGEQAVLNKEIFMQGTGADEDVFGYQERWAEYRYKPSRTTNNMRSTNPLSLDIWHYGLHFLTLPALNDVFIEDDPPIDRTQVVTADPSYLADFFFDYRCARPMPTFSVPGLVDHF